LRKIGTGLKFVIVGGIAIAIFFFLFPVLWLVLTSLKTTKLVFSVPPAFLFRPTFQSYYDLFIRKGFGQYVLNSAYVACFSTVVGLILAIPAAYILSQAKRGFSRALLVGLLIIRMVPPIIFLVPIYIVYSKLDLLGSRLGLMLGYQVFLIPFATWVIWSSFKDLPRDLADASRIDGCSPIETLLYIFLPLAIPTIGVAFIFCFIFCWNEFMFALVLTGRVTRTAPVVTATFLGERDIDWPAIAAAGTALITPTVVLMFFVAERLVRGLTAGALKE
jgi:multiple sugar transport system permease protein